MNRPRSKSTLPMLLENAATLPWYARDPATACRPLGEFLLWAVERGLAPDHAQNLEQIRFSPGAYVVNECDSKLTLRDFATHAHALIARAYGEYREHEHSLAGPMSRSARELLARLLEKARLPPAPAPAKPADPFFPGPVAHHEGFGEGGVLRADPGPDGTERYAVVVEWPEGTCVTHPKFGPGRVSRVEGRGPDAKLGVRFESGEERTLLAKFITRAPVEP